MKDIKDIRDKFQRAQDAWSDDRKRYVEDVRFGAGEQWPEDIVRERERDGRPVLKVDKINQFVRQVINDARQNRAAIKVRPVDDLSDPDTAEIYQGICRHIEDRSNADTAYDTALECGVRGGFGFFRILTEYESEDTFNQELCIKRIRNPLTVTIDPDIQEPDGSDMRFAFVFEDIERDEFKRSYKDADPVDWDSDDVRSDDWFGDKVRIAEYWYVEEEEKNLHLLGDGTTTTDEELELAASEGIPLPQIVDTRKVPCKQVYWSKVHGLGYIEKPRKWPGKWIPIIPVWGNEEDIEGELRHTGLIHNAKDAQRLYNFSRSAFAERVALAPKAPYVAAAGQVEEYADEWNTANQANHSVLVYDPIEINGHPVPPPQRQQASDIPVGFAQDMQLCEHDIQSSIGMYQASLGQVSNEKSGRAILARQREGDIATFHYHDNLARAIRHCGRILVDLIPKIYDSRRIVRIMGVDGTPDRVMIDPELPEAKRDIQTPEGVKSIYNLGVGKYDVTVTVGPSYTTKRQESADAMIQLVQGNPQLMHVMGDLMIRNMDWPGADEIADRLKLMLPPQIAQTEQDQGLPPESMAVIQQAQQAIQERDQVLQQVMGQLQELTAKLQDKSEENQIKAYEAETRRIDVMAKAANEERDLEVKVAQMVSQRIDQLLTNELRATQ